MGFNNYRKVLVGVIVFLILYNYFTTTIFENRFNFEKKKNNKLEKQIHNNNGNIFKINNAIGICNDILFYENYLYFVGDRAQIADVTNPSKPIFHYFNNTRYFDPKEIARVNNVLFVSFYDYPNAELLAKIIPDENITKLTIIPDMNFSLIKMTGMNDKLFLLNRTYISSQEHCVLAIYNATESGNISLVKKHILDATISNFYLSRNYIYTIESENKLKIYNINSSYDISFTNEYVFNSTINSLYFTNNSLFICMENGLSLYNYSNPYVLTKQCEYLLNSVRSVSVSSTNAYVVGERQIYKFDITSVTNIKLLKSKTISNRIFGDLKKIIEKDGLLYIMTELTCSTGEMYEDFLLIYSSGYNIRRIYPVTLPLSNPTRIFLFFGGIIVIVVFFSSIIVINKLLKHRQKNKIKKMRNFEKEKEKV